MSSPGESVRSLRFSLARALGEADEPRTDEALAELERALAEPGDDPPAEQIQLAAGGLLETVNPTRALHRYLAALSGAAGDEAVTRAGELLNRVDDPLGVIASLPPDAVESAQSLALRSPSPARATLASSLMRGQGRDEEALAVLQKAHGSDDPLDCEVSAKLAETLLDLDRGDEAFELVMREDPQQSHPSIQVVRAQAHLARGEASEALEVAELALKIGSKAPEAVAVAALSLLALEGSDAARERLPAIDAPEIQLARAIIELQARDYAQARNASWALLRARPTDPDSQLINAQAVVEGVGTSEDDSTTQASANAPPAGAEIDAARSLLVEVATDLPRSSQFSRWWRIQLAVRSADGRFAYFWAELRFALGLAIAHADLDAPDRTQTTWVQDAALEELKAKVLDRMGDKAGAAAASDEAARIFRETAVDIPRAAKAAREAHQSMPTPERARQFADSALSASYEDGLDEEAALAYLDDGRTAAERSLPDADDEASGELIHLIAWLRGRHGELDPIGAPEVRSVLLPWLFAGVALKPDDAVLRALLAANLSELERPAAALACGQTAYQTDPDIAYVAEMAVVTAANYCSSLEPVKPLLEQHATLSDEESWRTAIELYLCQVAGDREGAERLLDSAIFESAWAVRARAATLALRDGLAAARPDLEAARKATLEDTPPDLLGAVFYDAVLRDVHSADEHLNAGRDDDQHASEDGLEGVRIVRRFAFDTEMTVDEFVRSRVPLCEAPRNVGALVNVTLPLLAAARSRDDSGPVPRVPIDQGPVDARLQELADELPRWHESLDREGPGLVALARLADPLTGLSALAEAALDAAATCPDDLLRSVLDRVGRLVVSRAAAALPQQLMEVRVGRRESVDAQDVALALDRAVDLPASSRLLVAALGSDGSNTPAVSGDVAEEEELEAARLVSDLARGMDLDPEEWWRLDDALAAGSASTDPVVARIMAAARSPMLDLLGELIGPSMAWWPSPRHQPLVLTLGPGLVPLEAGPEWDAFIERLAAVRAGILSDTGFEPPVETMTLDWERSDTLRMLVNDAPLAASSVPADLDVVVGRVEEFTRDHLSEFVSVADVAELLSPLSPEVFSRITSDPVTLLRALSLLRDAVARGEAQDRFAVATQIAEETPVDHERYAAGA